MVRKALRGLPRAEDIDRLIVPHSDYLQRGRLPQTGRRSTRQYIWLRHLFDSNSVMIVENGDDRENVLRYAGLTQHLRDLRVTVPEIRWTGSDARSGILRVDDMGTDRLADGLLRYPSSENHCYREAVDVLVKISDPETPPPASVETHHVSVEIPRYDEATRWRESSLLVDWWLPGVGRSVPADARIELRSLLEEACAAAGGREALMIRDFHAEKILWLNCLWPHPIGLVHYWHARIGHPAYDLVSLAEDASREISLSLQEMMFERFVWANGMNRAERVDFLAVYRALGAQRNLMLMGALARDWLRAGEPQAFERLPRVWRNLTRNLQNPRLGDLRRWIERHVPEPNADNLARLRAAAPGSDHPVQANAEVPVRTEVPARTVQRVKGTPLEGCARAAEVSAFIHRFGYGAEHLRPIQGDASARQYFRLVAKWERPESVLMVGDREDRDSVLRFAAITEHLRAAGLRVPEIYEFDLELGMLILEDLGSSHLSRVGVRRPSAAEEPYREAVDALIALAAPDRPPPPERLVFAGRSCEIPRYDEKTLWDEASLLLDWWLPAAGRPASAESRAEFRQLLLDACTIAGEGRDVLVLRDFHSENLLLQRNEREGRQIALLDYQDARRGHPAYDLVSLAEDARRDTSPALRAMILERFLGALRIHGEDREQFLAAYQTLGTQRNLKIIGIFTRLWIRDGKPQYLDLIPRVWRHLMRDLRHPRLHALRHWIATHVPAPDSGALVRVRGAGRSP